MMLKQLALFVLPLAIGCSGDVDSATDESNEALIGGAADKKDPNVVLLIQGDIVNGGELGFCTASFIAPTKLLAAAHCLEPVPGAPAEFNVYLGPDLAQVKKNMLVTAPDFNPALLVPVVSTIAHPAFNAALSPPENPNDLSIITIATPQNVALLAVATDISSLKKGTAVRLIGYGADKHSGPTPVEKRASNAKIDGISATDIHAGNSADQICNGDSGGPMISTLAKVPTIVAVAHYVESAVNGKDNCIGGGYSVRVDVPANAQFIAANR
jgi:hypothetical protein